MPTEISASEAGRALVRRRWEDPNQRERVGVTMYVGRLRAAARALDPEGDLDLEGRVEPAVERWLASR